MNASTVRTLAVFLLAVVTAGCVHEQAGVSSPAAFENTLTVTRAGEEVTLSWPSRPDLLYTVMYTDKLGGGQWKALSGAVNMRGTGDSILVRDSVIGAERRFYRLQTVPVSTALSPRPE